MMLGGSLDNKIKKLSINKISSKEIQQRVKSLFTIFCQTPLIFYAQSK